LGVGRKASNLAPGKNPKTLKMLNYGKPDRSAGEETVERNN